MLIGLRINGQAMKGKKRPFIMKKTPIILFFAVQLLCFPASITTLPGEVTSPQSTLKLRRTFTLDTLTIYNPVRGQCDDDPLVTASNRKIDLARLRNGDLRWMALSREMLSRWGGELKYGDTLTVNAGDNAIDGEWIIQDTMAKRFSKHGDLLFHQVNRKTGRWTNVTVQKTEKYYLASR
jgi:hypothetical protein